MRCFSSARRPGPIACVVTYRLDGLKKLNHFDLRFFHFSYVFSFHYPSNQVFVTEAAPEENCVLTVRPKDWFLWMKAPVDMFHSLLP